jgi:hypothetical protein
MWHDRRWMGAWSRRKIVAVVQGPHRHLLLTATHLPLIARARAITRTRSPRISVEERRAVAASAFFKSIKLDTGNVLAEVFAHLRRNRLPVFLWDDFVVIAALLGLLVNEAANKPSVLRVTLWVDVVRLRKHVSVAGLETFLQSWLMSVQQYERLACGCIRLISLVMGELQG